MYFVTVLGCMKIKRHSRLLCVLTSYQVVYNIDVTTIQIIQADCFVFRVQNGNDKIYSFIPLYWMFCSKRQPKMFAFMVIQSFESSNDHTSIYLLLPIHIKWKIKR